MNHDRRELAPEFGRASAPAIVGRPPRHKSSTSGQLSTSIPDGRGVVDEVAGRGSSLAMRDKSCPRASPWAFVRSINGKLGSLQLAPFDPAERQKNLNVEMANGRRAMIAISGDLSWAARYGSVRGDRVVYASSSQRALRFDARVVSDALMGAPASKPVLPWLA